MIRTNSTVVRTSKFRLRMGLPRVLGRLIVVPDLLVVFDIVCDHHLLKAVLGTPLGHVHRVVFEDDLCVDLAVTHDAKTLCVVVVDIISILAHKGINIGRVKRDRKLLASNLLGTLHMTMMDQVNGI